MMMKIQGRFGVIPGTFGVIPGTFSVIQGTFGVIQMMMIIRTFGQFGLWAPTSGVQDVFTSTAYVFTYTRRRGVTLRYILLCYVFIKRSGNISVGLSTPLYAPKLCYSDHGLPLYAQGSKGLVCVAWFS
jgi:hypothetical protein